MVAGRGDPANRIRLTIRWEVVLVLVPPRGQSCRPRPRGRGRLLSCRLLTEAPLRGASSDRSSVAGDRTPIALRHLAAATRRPWGRCAVHELVERALHEREEVEVGEIAA